MFDRPKRVAFYILDLGKELTRETARSLEYDGQE